MMPKFNPKKHDLSSGEAKFLTGLSKLSIKEIKGQIEKAASEITESRANIKKAKATIEKRINTALTEARKGAKQHGVLKKKMAQVDVLFWLIDKSPPEIGNVIAKKLERLNQDVGKCESSMNTCLSRATSEIGSAGSTYAPLIAWTGTSTRIVPSQPTVILLTP